MPSPGCAGGHTRPRGQAPGRRVGLFQHSLRRHAFGVPRRSHPGCCFRGLDEGRYNRRIFSRREASQAVGEVSTADESCVGRMEHIDNTGLSWRSSSRAQHDMDRRGATCQGFVSSSISRSVSAETWGGGAFLAPARHEPKTGGTFLATFEAYLRRHEQKTR